MANIGDLYFLFHGSEGTLTQDATRAADRAGTAAGGRLNASVSSQLKASLLGGFGLGAGLGVFGLVQSGLQGIAGALGDAVKAAAEDEASNARLVQSLRDNVPAWNGNTDAVERFIAKGQELAYTDDQSRDSLTKLAAATHDERKAMDLSRTAMDLARLRGIDLATATDLIAKAYAGNVGAVRKVLPWIDKHATATEALAAIQKAAAGQAETYANTSAGALERASIQQQEALEALGRAMSPIVTVAASALADNLRWLARDVDDVTTAIQTLGGILPKTGSDFDVLGSILNGVTMGGYGAWSMANKLRDAQEEAAAKAVEHADAIATAKDALSEFAAETKVVAAVLPEEVELGVDRSVAIVALAPAQLAASIRDKRTAWQEAVKLLGTDLENAMTTAQEAAKIRAELTSQKLADGLKSKDPVVKAQAEATTQLLVDRLAELEHGAGLWGERTGNAYADGLIRSKNRVKAASLGLSGIVRTEFEAHSPPGPGSSLHLIGEWGRRTGEVWAEGLRAGVGTFAGPGLRAAGSVAAGFAALPAAAGIAGGPGSPVVIEIPLDGARIARVVDEHLYYRRNS